MKKGKKNILANNKNRQKSTALNKNTQTSSKVVAEGGLFCYVISGELSEAEGKGSGSSRLVGKCVFISK